MQGICEESTSKINLLAYIDRLILIKESDSGHKSLEKILEEVMNNQIMSCKYHNTLENDFTYFFDHSCRKEIIPYRSTASIENYNEEILNLVYSNSFKYFAAVLKGNDIAFYKINKYVDFLKQGPSNNFEDYLKKSSFDINFQGIIQKAHENIITSIQWSKTDKLILTASKDKLIKLFDPITKECKLVISGHDGMVSSVIFVLNETKIISAGLDYKICMWSLQGANEFSVHVPNVTITELLYSEIYNILIVISATTNSILFYDIESKTEVDKIPMNDIIISCAISKLDNGVYLLINSSKATPALSLLNLKTKIIERKFFGHRQERFTIKCNFGGESENFIVCGSEDARVLIWSRNHSIPIYAIKAHSSPVNAVIWSHSHLTDIILSCSEDHTIKILTNDNVDKINFEKEVTFVKSKSTGIETKTISFEDSKLETQSISPRVNSSIVTSLISRISNYLANPFALHNTQLEHDSDEGNL
jgi:WD40 repeat protein